jgi:ribosomal protein S18 acetylase RimI-like enzyme
MDIEVRRALPEELDTVGELTARVYLDDGLLDFGESDSYATVLRDARTRALHAELLVAVDPLSGDVVGTVTFAADGSRYAKDAAAGEGEFRMLAVRKSSRGGGVGEALVRACMDRARGRGLHRLRLSTKHDMAAAHRLYERLGFARTPERDREPLPGVTLLAYAVELAPATES